MAKDVEVSFSVKDYHDPPSAPLIDTEELTKWSFYRALIAEFIATLLFLYITVLTMIGYKNRTDTDAKGDVCGGVGILGIAWTLGIGWPLLLSEVPLGCTFTCSFRPFLQLSDSLLTKYLIPSLSSKMACKPSVYILMGLPASHDSYSSLPFSSMSTPCATEDVNQIVISFA